MTFIFEMVLFLTSIFMILLVLVQRGKGGGLAGAFGGMGGQSAFGTKAGDLFTKITIFAAVFWIVLCLGAIAYLSTLEKEETDSVLGGSTEASEAGGAEATDGEGAGATDAAPSTTGEPAATDTPATGAPAATDTPATGAPAATDAPATGAPAATDTPAAPATTTPAAPATTTPAAPTTTTP